jgi:hypothetical protein
MTVTPTGSPAWERTANHETYGGNINKRNYQSQGPVNPRTDVDAAEFSRMVADVAAMVQTAPFAVLTFTTNDTSPAAPTVDNYNGMHGSAPPTGARVSNGVAQFDWDASYLDAYGVSGDVHITHAVATCHGTGGNMATVVISDPDANSKNERVTVYATDDTGTASTDITVSVVVYTGAP